MAPKVQLKVVGLDCVERSLDYFNLWLGLFADKFQSDMQRFRPHPAHIWSKSATTIQKACNPVPDIIVNIERYEEAHKKLLAIGS